MGSRAAPRRFRSTSWTWPDPPAATLFPTGSNSDRIEGIEVTCIDNGMPVVVMRAADLGKRGDESPEELEADAALKARIERIRLAVGPRMNLGDVAKKTVPKMCLVSPAAARRHHPHAHLHTAPRARGHRRARCRQRRHRLRHAGLGGRAGRGPHAALRSPAAGDRASDRILHGGDGRDAGGWPHVTVKRSALLAHGAQADAGRGVCPGERVERVDDRAPPHRPDRPRRSRPGAGATTCTAAERCDLCAWDRLFPVAGSEPQRAAAALPSLAAASAMAEAVRGSSLVICAVTAGECLAAARGSRRGAHARRVLSGSQLGVAAHQGGRPRARSRPAGGRYVEAAVMSPIAPQRIASPVWLGGPHAAGLPAARAVARLHRRRGVFRHDRARRPPPRCAAASSSRAWRRCSPSRC